jgi:ornithine cyclodeaminase
MRYEFSPGGRDAAGQGLLDAAAVGAAEAAFAARGTGGAAAPEEAAHSDIAEGLSPEALRALCGAVSGAVAARLLAPAEVETAAVIGTGAQARLQMRAAHLVRPFRRLLVWGRDPGKAAACAGDLGAALGVEVEMMSDIGAALAEAQLVVTATAARAPLIRAEWLHDGMHLTAMGSDAPGKGEVEPAALAVTDLYVCDCRSGARRSGEMQAALRYGIWGDSHRPPELGEVAAARAEGRRGAQQVTLCDLTGTLAGAPGLAAAMAAHARVRLARAPAVNA